MLHHNKSHNSNRDWERHTERQAERVDNSIRVVKVVFMPQGIGTMMPAAGMCVYLWNEAKHIQLVMANVSEHLTGDEQDSPSVCVCVCVCVCWCINRVFLQA